MIELPSTFIITVIIGSALAGLACSLIGTFIVQMDLTSIGFSMSHAAFAGAALGLLIPVNPTITAIGFALLVALLLGPISEKAKLSPGVIIGVSFPISMALAFIFINLQPTAATSEALNLLWGNLYSLTVPDLAYLSILSAGMILIITVFKKEFLSILFDKKMAKASGINTRPFYFSILFLTGLTVAVSLKFIGGLLVYALIVNTAASAYQFTYDIKKMFILSPIIGIICSLSGTWLSLQLNTPIGTSIVIMTAIVFTLSVLFSRKRGKGGGILPLHQ